MLSFWVHNQASTSLPWQERSQTGKQWYAFSFLTLYWNIQLATWSCSDASHHLSPGHFVAELYQANNKLLLTGSWSYLPPNLTFWLKTRWGRGWGSSTEWQGSLLSAHADYPCFLPLFHVLLVSFALLGHSKQNISLGRGKRGEDCYHESPTSKTVQCTCSESQNSLFFLLSKPSVVFLLCGKKK